MLTLPKVAKLLGIGLTTLRYRCEACQEYIPYHRQGKYKVYDETAIQIIQHINKLYESGKDITEILPILDQQYDRQIVVQEEQAMQTINEQDTGMTLAERNTFLVEELVERFDKQYELERRIALLEQQINNMTFWQWLKNKFGG